MSNLTRQPEGKSGFPKLSPAMPVLVLILANNEASVITGTVQSVQQVLEPGDMLLVVADNCTDETATLAKAGGATVLERRTETSSSKGAALKWFVGQCASQLAGFSLLVILDADNRLPPGFIRQLKTLYPGKGVLQCLVQPVAFSGSQLSTLIALSELHEQRTIDGLRARLGWPIRLRGTGMILPPGLLVEVVDELETQVEDFALSLLIASRRITVRRENRICVYDAKPGQLNLAARQRARWYRGQWSAIRHYRREIARLLLRGPAGWGLLASLFLKPRWLVDLLCILLGILFIHSIWWLAFLFLLRVAVDFILLVWTILVSPQRWIFAKAMLFFPGFILMWLRGFFLAIHRANWLRGR